MARPGPLRLTSCQADNAEHLARAVARYLGRRLGVPTEFVDGISWQERERLLDRGAIHVGWICGLPYVARADRPRPGVSLLAAPVMAGMRYAGRPVYFSDVLVRADSPARCFGDLRGSRWGYNEPRSHSGYEIVRYQLAMRSEQAGFFRAAVETGAHQATLQLIVDGKVDASAVDSTVLETEIRRRPALGRALRVIETWGPSPAPPWVASRRLPAGLRSQLRGLMLGMHLDPAGRAILREARMRRFGKVSDADYNPIRRMTGAAAAVTLSRAQALARGDYATSARRVVSGQRIQARTEG